MHSISFTGPRLAQPQELGGGTYLQLPRSPLGVGNTDYSLPGSPYGRGSAAQLPQASFGVGHTDYSLPGSSSGSGAYARSGNSAASVPTLVGGSAFGTPSPYRGIVVMSHYVSGAGSADSKNEYVALHVPQDARVPVNISEWVLESDASGKASPIPKGTELPANGVINAAQSIVLSPGMRAIIVSGQSPIGASFRENKCIGYFGSFQTFYPTLPRTCPMPSSELSSLYGTNYIRDPSCVDYVSKLQRCQVMLSPPPILSGTCQSFVVKYFNYNGCVDAHKNDADFMGNTWRIYLGRTTPMWRTTRELVKLFDMNGKTVDAFSY